MFRDGFSKRDKLMQQSNGKTFESFDFRKHYDANYTNGGLRYEQYIPAYRYGVYLAEDPRFSDWDTFEPAARAQWDGLNPGTWDQYKDAIRYAWEQARGAAAGA